MDIILFQSSLVSLDSLIPIDRFIDMAQGLMRFQFIIKLIYIGFRVSIVRSWVETISGSFL
jgi:hypothetical protein